VLGVVGDFDAPGMKQLLCDTFRDWKPSPVQPKDAPVLPSLEDSALAEEASSSAAGRIFLVDKPGEQEASVLLAEPGISLGDPDEPALDVLDDILNGFGGRLFNKVRSKYGLTYSVYGGWEAPPQYRGLFTAGGNTEAPAALISAIREVLNEVLDSSPPTEEEVSISKTSASNSFVFNFASKKQQLSRVLVYHVLGLPPDYLIQYQRALYNVALEDVIAAAKRHLHPERQTVVVVGDAAKIEGPLRRLSGSNLQRLPLVPPTEDQA